MSQGGRSSEVRVGMRQAPAREPGRCPGSTAQPRPCGGLGGSSAKLEEKEKNKLRPGCELCNGGDKEARVPQAEAACSAFVVPKGGPGPGLTQGTGHLNMLLLLPPEVGTGLEHIPQISGPSWHLRLSPYLEMGLLQL
jgi:hypothetical protein